MFFALLPLAINAQSNLEKDIKPALPFEAMPLTQAPELKNDPFERTIEITVKNNAEHPLITNDLKKSIEAIREEDKDTFYKYSSDITIKIFSRQNVLVREKSVGVSNHE